MTTTHEPVTCARGIEPLSDFEHVPDFTWKGAFRPSITHWNRGREPKLLNLVQVAEQLDMYWGSNTLTLYEEYHGDQPCCLFVDYDCKLPVDGSLERSFADLEFTVVSPINQALGSVHPSLGNLSTSQVAISHDCRVVRHEDEDYFKASFHCVWPMVRVNRAGLIGGWLDELSIPPTADRKVYATGRRLFRVIGSRKDLNSRTFLQPYGAQHPFYSHLIQHTVLASADLELRPPPDQPPLATRQRLQPLGESVERAPWLRGLSDNDLKLLAIQQLKQKNNHCHDNFEVGRVVGSAMYCKTDPAGRVCWDGTPHQRNNFVLTFKRNGQLMYRCFGSGCSMQQSQEIGRWFDGFGDMMQRLDTLLTPGPDIDMGLLEYLQTLVLGEVEDLQSQPGRKGKAKPSDLPNWGRLKKAVVDYLNHYWAYIKDIDAYAIHTVDTSGNPTQTDYRKLSDTKALTLPYCFWFEQWNRSPQRRMFSKVVSVPGKPLAIDRNYNIAANLMPNLHIPMRRLSASDLESIQPLLRHQREYLCGGNSEVFDYWMLWQARIIQRPSEKTGVAPLFFGTQGCGKGIICNSLFGRIWQGHHTQITDFDAAVGHFNSHLKNKMMVNLDECGFMGNITDQNKLKGLVTEPTWTLEEKFKSKVTLNSYHNYVITTNHDKTVRVENGERRFFIVEAVTPPASYDWTVLWDAVADPDTVECYIQHLLSIDCRSFRKGQAPLTQAKREALAKQRPVAAAFCQALCEDPRMFCTGDYDGSTDKYVIKSRHDRSDSEREAYASCLNDQVRFAKDLSSVAGQARTALGNTWTGIPVAVVTGQISRWASLQRIRGQDMNNDAWLDDLRKLGIVKKQTTQSGSKVYHLRFPTVEGLEWKLRSMNWFRDD